MAKVDIAVALFIKHFILCSRKYGVELISQCSPTSNYSMKLHTIAWILIIVGALNWGLVGLGGLLGGNWNVVSMILGSWPVVEAIVYVLVGASAVYELVNHKKTCRECVSGGSM